MQNTNSDNILKFAQKNIFPTLLERDQKSYFDLILFQETVSSISLSRSPSKSSSDFEFILNSFYNLGLGGLDIPFSVSIVAQFISICILKEFGSDDQKLTYMNKLENGEKLASIANSEISGGTDIRSMQSNIVVLNDKYYLNAYKPCVTNCPADLIFLSTWIGNENKRMEVLILPAENLKQELKSTEIFGFQTGLTGSCLATNLELNYPSVRLGNQFDGFKILKYSFDLERLLISCVLAGALEKVLNLSVEYIQNRKSFSKNLVDHQHIQEKIVRIYNAKHTIKTLIDYIKINCESLSINNIRNFDMELSHLKYFAVEQSFLAFTEFFELMGHSAVRVDHIAQKLLRDTSLLKFLGGTKELQKQFILNNLIDQSGAKNEKRRSPKTA